MVTGGLTFDVGHDQHLGLRKPLLEVVEVDGAVEGDETNLRPRVSRKPKTLTRCNEAKELKQQQCLCLCSW